MIGSKRSNVEEFQDQYLDSRCQCHEGDVWQAQAVPDHSYLQFCISKVLGYFFHRTEGPKGPGGWWFFDEAGGKYGETSLFFSRPRKVDKISVSSTSAALSHHRQA